MAKKKKSKSRKKKGPSLKERIIERLHEPRVWIYSGFFVAALSLLIGIHVGVSELQKYVYSHDEFLGPPAIELLDAPPELEEELANWIDHKLLEKYGDDLRWSDPTLCKELENTLNENSWVQYVDCVRKYPDGRITAQCHFRLPFAQVRCDGRFYLVSRDCVRLPGYYNYNASLLMVEGVGGQPPAVHGEKWKNPALRSALDIVECLASMPQEMLSQFTGILVNNYGGKLNAEESHIVLTTDRSGHRILWGSAPGEELEENTVEEKLGILKDNFERYGRVDANLPLIDISIRPDRFFASHERVE